MWTPFELFLFSGAIICLRCLLPDAIHFLISFCFLVCAVLAFITHDSCICFSFLVLVSFGSLTWFCHLACWIFCIVPLIFYWRGSMLYCMFHVLHIKVGFRRPCWCSLTGSPGFALVPLPRPQVSLRMLFPILHLWVSSPASPTCVVLRFHCSS